MLEKENYPPQAGKARLFIEGIVRWVRARPNTGGFIHQYAVRCFRTAMRSDARRLVWQEIRRVNRFGLKSNLTTSAITILDLHCLPNFNCHSIPPVSIANECYLICNITLDFCGA
jgi:hypothetical protein